MTADLLFDDVDAMAVPSGQAYRVAINQVFTVKLNHTRPPLRWVSDKDLVLAIEDDGGINGRITAAQKGSSLLQIFSGEREVYRLRLIVRESNDQTVSVKMKFTNVRAVDQP